MVKNITSRAGLLLKSPHSAIVIITILVTVGWHILLSLRGVSYNFKVSFVILVIDMAVTFLLLDGLTYFFAQFVLPIQDPKDRQEIYKRVRDFSSGKRGPAIFIKNGRIIEHENEKDKKGPGVVLLDTASAAVLRTDIEFIAPIGPGVRFTKVHKHNNDDFNEYIANSVDLRTQWALIGPMSNDQPFLNPVPFLTPQEYNAVKSRLQETSGWTRDGFEVAPTLSIKFRVKRSSNTQTSSGILSRYGFDPTHVNNSIVNEPMKLEKQTHEKELMEWDKLPVHLVVNLWREYIRKFKLEDLFTSGNENSALQVIENKINEHVRLPKFSPLDEIGTPLAGFLDNPEYKELQEHGIEIIEVRIRTVVFDPELEKKMAGQWSGEWLRAEKTKEGLLKKRDATTEALAHNRAIKNFAITASKNFSDTTNYTDKKIILKTLIEPFMEAITIESASNEELKNIREKLDSVWRWLLSAKNEK